MIPPFELAFTVDPLVSRSRGFASASIMHAGRLKS
jgi:hypothetical protein